MESSSRLMKNISELSKNISEPRKIFSARKYFCSNPENILYHPENIMRGTAGNIVKFNQTLPLQNSLSIKTAADQIRTLNKRHSPCVSGNDLTLYSLKKIPEPATKSFTVRETKILPAPASPAIRCASLTAKPAYFSP